MDLIKVAVTLRGVIFTFQVLALQRKIDGENAKPGAAEWRSWINMGVRFRS